MNQENKSNPLYKHLTRKQMKAYKRIQRKNYRDSLNNQVTEEVRVEFKNVRRRLAYVWVMMVFSILTIFILISVGVIRVEYIR